MASRHPRAQITIPVEGAPKYRRLAVTYCSVTLFFIDGRWRCEFVNVHGLDSRGRDGGCYELDPDPDGTDWPDYLRTAVAAWHESVLEISQTVASAAVQ